MQQAPDDARTFYRITRTNPPMLSDFLTNVAKNRRPQRDDPETLRLWDGISVSTPRRTHVGRHTAFPRSGASSSRYESLVTVPYTMSRLEMIRTTTRFGLLLPICWSA
jgi:hypothetical protein